MSKISRRTAIQWGAIGATMLAARSASFGASNKEKEAAMRTAYDVLIVGGGPAGLSAALCLGRMGRTVLVCDDGRPRNAPAEHMNNFPSRDGLAPGEWRKEVRRDLKKYKTVEFHQGQVTAIERQGHTFKAKLANGKSLDVRKVILAYGVLDKMPDVPGYKELWGKAIYHCPFCHGYEVRGHRLGLVGNGKFAEHFIPMIASLTDDLILFTNGPADLSAETKELLKKRKIPLVEEKILSLVPRGNSLQTVVMDNGTLHKREGLFWMALPPFQLKSNLGAFLGCEKNEWGFYKTELAGKTNVPGVFAAGDIMLQAHSVLNAASAGQMAGAFAASELLNENFQGKAGGKV